MTNYYDIWSLGSQNFVKLIKNRPLTATGMGNYWCRAKFRFSIFFMLC